MSAIANRFIKYQRDIVGNPTTQPEISTLKLNRPRKVLIPLRRPRCLLEAKSVPVIEKDLFGHHDANSGFESTTLYQHALRRYNKCTKHYDDVQKILDPFVNDLKLNSYRFELQKAVNLIINSISPVSDDILMEKFRKLANLLAGRPADNGTVSPYSHSLGIIYIKVIIAKKFLLQGQIATSSQLPALAFVLVNLWLEYPDFGHIVMACFHKYCPFLAPVFLSQNEFQSDDEYYRSLGYRITDGIVEKHETFLTRMGAMMRFYAALLTVKPRNEKPNPLGLNEALRWLEVMLNLKPQPDLCALLILEMVQMTGTQLLITQNLQIKEMLLFLTQTYVPKLKQIANKNHSLAYIARLEILILSFTEKIKPVMVTRSILNWFHGFISVLQTDESPTDRL